MPVSFNFTRKSDGQVMTLNEIDRLMCLDCGLPCDPDAFCPLFVYAQMYGLSAMDGHSISREKLVKRLENDNELTPREYELLLKYLTDEYTYDCWR